MRSKIIGKLLFLILTFSALPVSSQEQEMIKVELMTISFSGGVGGLYYLSGGKVVELNASVRGLSSPVLYKGPRLLPIYDSAEKAEASSRKEGKEVPKPLKLIQLPAGQDRALLVFGGKKKDSTPLVKVYGVSTDGMKNGDYRLFNFSSKPVFAIVDKKKASVKAGKDQILSSAKWREKIRDIEVQFGTSVGGKVKKVYGSIWGHHPERRMFIFVFERDNRVRPLDIRLYFDTPAVRAVGVEEEPPG